MPPGMRISSARAAAAVGGDGEPVHGLGGVGIVGEEALDRMQVALARRAGQLQIGGVRPKRRAVGGRHQHAFGHVLQERLRRAARFAPAASGGFRQPRMPAAPASSATTPTVESTPTTAKTTSAPRPGRKEEIAARRGEEHDHQRRDQGEASAGGSRPSSASPVRSCRISPNPRESLSDSLGRARPHLVCLQFAFQRRADGT